MLDKLWLILILILIYFGISFSKKINFINLKPKKLLNFIDKEGLFVSLGTKMGVGSIIGTAMSILIGGAGSVFWMIVFTIITSSIIYFESFLGSKYKKKINDSYVSGPYFYTKFGLRKSLLSLIITILLIMTYSHFFLMIQTNTIIELIQINKTLLTLIIFIFLLLTIILEIKNIISILNKLTPIMCALFIGVGVFIIFKNINILPQLLTKIFKEAFSIKGITSGMIIGIKRSIFQTELLIGTTAISSGINNMENKDVASTQVIGAYFINFIISVLTALLILIFIYYNEINVNNYNDLLIKVFSFHLGRFGEFFLILEVILFSITTILSGFYMGISIVKFNTNNTKVINLIKSSMLFFCMLGLFINTDTIWLLIDIIMFIIIILNAYVLYKLKGEVNDR